jgi:hypothetical protein
MHFLRSQDMALKKFLLFFVTFYENILNLASTSGNLEPENSGFLCKIAEVLIKTEAFKEKKLL